MLQKKMLRKSERGKVDMSAIKDFGGLKISHDVTKTEKLYKIRENLQTKSRQDTLFRKQKVDMIPFISSIKNRQKCY